jgi:hypothetical protein
VVAWNFQKYEDYCSEDFATDNYFSQWILSPNNLIISFFWESFLKKHPEKEHEIEMARNQILNPQTNQNQLSQQDIESLWQRINETIITNN